MENVLLFNLANEKLRRVFNFVKEGMEIAVKFGSKRALTSLLIRAYNFQF